MKDFWIDLLTGLIKIKCNKKVSKKALHQRPMD